MYGQFIPELILNLGFVLLDFLENFSDTGPITLRTKYQKSKACVAVSRHVSQRIRTDIIHIKLRENYVYFKCWGLNLLELS